MVIKFLVNCAVFYSIRIFAGVSKSVQTPLAKASQFQPKPILPPETGTKWQTTSSSYLINAPLHAELSYTINCRRFMVIKKFGPIYYSCISGFIYAAAVRFIADHILYCLLLLLLVIMTLSLGACIYNVRKSILYSPYFYSIAF